MNEILYLFGLGTGRCGTVSLARLLNKQIGSSVTHEERPWLPWKQDPISIRNKATLLTQKAKEQKLRIVGDVALFNLQSVETLLSFLPSAKFVALKRGKEATLDSFQRKWKPKYNRIRYKKTEWDYVFPKYDLPILEAVSKYYDTYYTKVSELEGTYPRSVKCFDVQLLNSYVGVKSILDFCEVPEELRKLVIGIQANKGSRK